MICWLNACIPASYRRAIRLRAPRLATSGRWNPRANRPSLRPPASPSTSRRPPTGRCVGPSRTTTPTAVSVDRVTLRWRVRTNGHVRVYRHGYQSWSATGTAVLGTAEDPSRTPGSIGLVRNVHHADAAIAPAGELRSELVTVLADDDGALLFGFEGGAHHDGTFRVRAVGDGLVEVDAEAYLGGAELASHSTRTLHPIRVATGEPTVELERWADWVGAAASARTRTPYQVGWCSWYQYFHAVTEHDIRTNLAARTTGRSTCSSSTTASNRRSATGSTARTRFRDRSTHSPRHRRRGLRARDLDRAVHRVAPLARRAIAP